MSGDTGMSNLLVKEILSAASNVYLGTPLYRGIVEWLGNMSMVYQHRMVFEKGFAFLGKPLS